MLGKENEEERGKVEPTGSARYAHGHIMGSTFGSYKCYQYAPKIFIMLTIRRTGALTYLYP